MDPPTNELDGIAPPSRKRGRFESRFADLGKISALEAPHRVYDAILRDALLDTLAEG